jgi:transposase
MFAFFTLPSCRDRAHGSCRRGYSYSRFCELHRGFESKLSPTMRQTHAAGERLFVDYAGDGVPVVVDRLTGEIRNAQIFVAVLGASTAILCFTTIKSAGRMTPRATLN